MNAIADLCKLEDAGYEVHVIDIFWRESKLLRGCHPSHAHIVGVLAGKVENTSAFDFELAESKPLTEEEGDQQRDCRFAVTGSGGERVDEPALQPADNEVI